MQILGQFIVKRRKELGLAGREVVAEVRNSHAWHEGHHSET